MIFISTKAYMASLHLSALPKYLEEGTTTYHPTLSLSSWLILTSPQLHIIGSKLILSISKWRYKALYPTRVWHQLISTTSLCQSSHTARHSLPVYPAGTCISLSLVIHLQQFASYHCNSDLNSATFCGNCLGRSSFTPCPRLLSLMIDDQPNVEQFAPTTKSPSCRRISEIIACDVS